jgi:hypothetical protein
MAGLAAQHRAPVTPTTAGPALGAGAGYVAYREGGR